MGEFVKSDEEDVMVDYDKLSEELEDILVNAYANRKLPDQLNLPKPGGKETIWRYIDFTQYLSILHNEALHFSRPDSFKDKFEGSLPKRNVQKRREWIENFNMVQNLEERLNEKYGVSLEDYTGEDEIEINSSGTFPDEALDLIVESYKNANKRILEGVALNCWHKESREKAAMWDLYSQSGYGISIKSSYNNIQASLEAIHEKETDTDINWLRKCLVGEVTYVDYRTEEIPDTIIHPFFHKRNSFSHENEVRIAYIALDQVEPSGEYIDINVEELIDEVRLEPKSPEWYENLVRGVTESLSYSIQIERSELETDPLY